MSDKFVSPCPPPSPRLSEFMYILTEEGCEVGQRAMKALRFGDEETQPGQPFTNLERLEEEVGDFLGTVAAMVDEGYLDRERLERLADKKKNRKLPKFMQTEPE